MLLDHYSYGLRPAAAGPLARRLEEAGVDGVFYAESNRDPSVAVALTAEHTNRMTVGTGISIAFSRSPMTMAYLAHALQEVADGRFVLGLGSQVKAHIERRFGMPWSQPVPRMREYVAALHAIWDCWNGTGDLRFQGDFYQFSLMPEPFRPAPGLTRPPVYIAAVGPAMARVAGAVADGLVAHPFSGAGYLRDRVTPELRGAADGSDRTIALVASAMVATGADEAELARNIAQVREKIAFYASTPSYLPVLDYYGCTELHTEARSLVAAGRYTDLPALVDDTVLNWFAVVAGSSDLPEALLARYTGSGATRLAISTDHEFSDSEWNALATAFHGNVAA